MHKFRNTRVPRGGSKTPATSKMFFVALVDGWRAQTNNTTNTFILHVAMVLDTTLWNNY